MVDTLRHMNDEVEAGFAEAKAAEADTTKILNDDEVLELFK